MNWRLLLPVDDWRNKYAFTDGCHPTSKRIGYVAWNPDPTTAGNDRRSCKSNAGAVIVRHG